MRAGINPGWTIYKIGRLIYFAIQRERRERKRVAKLAAMHWKWSPFFPEKSGYYRKK